MGCKDRSNKIKSKILTSMRNRMTTLLVFTARVAEASDRLMIFTGICLSNSGGGGGGEGGVDQGPGHNTPSPRTWSYNTPFPPPPPGTWSQHPPPLGTWSQHSLPPRSWSQHPPPPPTWSQHPLPPDYAQAGGTHPTGMQFLFFKKLLRKSSDLS